ncbi:uncharacterized protein LOC106167393 [Lingula anatina]|uniref:Uncharacterized protein LOC106167393 n=1 Tax=Lingula anatina TaxID=7574 RepID=A0A1S3ITV3_LINAN|nr:uncharacterized protein LOC106167393 [Lingula anatina]XP_013401634.1 uncharacterized protein LOC106167393 [Lingula anatina]XP_013401635.1 uncharacterized protein LOC106167393 [Lingula anatina]|eukprot:XP_013401633.1 uncharacterized protein LOC106167393 [Lingula anatina]
MATEKTGETSTDLYSQVIIRPAKRADLDELFTLTDQVGWDVSKELLTALFDSLEQGHYIVADLHGKIIGSRFVVVLDENTVMFDFLIVDKKYRGNRIAKKIADATLKIAGERNVVLWSVPDRIELNKKVGMKIGGGNLYFCDGFFDPETLYVDKQHDAAEVKVVSASEVDFEALLAYDTSIITFQRRKFLKVWLAKPSAIAFVALTDGGEIVGYGQVQEAPHAYFISPLYADTPSAFMMLLKAIIESIPKNSKIFMIMNVDYVAWAEVLKRNKDKINVYPENPIQMMYTKENLVMPKFSSVFAISCTGAYPA